MQVNLHPPLFLRTTGHPCVWLGDAAVSCSCVVVPRVLQQVHDSAAARPVTLFSRAEAYGLC
jgi:hypothetical protein